LRRLVTLVAASGVGEKGIKLLAVVTALVIVSGVIVFDHFKGPLFADVFYCLNDGGSQIAGLCIAHRNLIAKRLEPIRR
jgi:hypothetical protein